MTSNSPIFTEVAAGLELRSAGALGMPTAAGAKAEAEANMAARRTRVDFICSRARAKQVACHTRGLCSAPGTNKSLHKGLAKMAP